MRDAQPSFDVGGATHVGRVRAENEDALIFDAGRGVFAVADGMGGHAGGKFASSIAVDALGRIPAPLSLDHLINDCAAAAGEANARILERSALNNDAVSGTTLAVLLTYGDLYACLWCGDSRVYLVRDGSIQQISHDHTEVQELLDQGVLSPEQARRWPRRNIITRAVGVGEDPELEIGRGTLMAGDRFVVCSDGLTNHIEDHEILAGVLQSDAQRACDILIELTLARGASDNVTIIVIGTRRSSSTVVLPDGLPAPPWT